MKQETKLIESLAKSRNKKEWLEYFDSIIREFTDVSNFNQDQDILLQLKVGLKVKEILTTKFINRIKALSQDSQDTDLADEFK